MSITRKDKQVVQEVAKAMKKKLVKRYQIIGRMVGKNVIPNMLGNDPIAILSDTAEPGDVILHTSHFGDDVETNVIAINTIRPNGSFEGVLVNNEYETAVRLHVAVDAPNRRKILAARRERLRKHRQQKSWQDMLDDMFGPGVIVAGQEPF